MKLLKSQNINRCETCKYYDKCSKNIYYANLERRYSIIYLNKDCWED